jgi:MoxR-like ATPase
MTDTFTPLHTRFGNLAVEVSTEIHERSQEVHTAILAALSNLHHFQLGPPGTAKSLLVDRIYRRIDGLTDDDYFRYLMAKTTAPEELFGGLNLLTYKETGVFERNTDRMLPVARIGFLDEIFKAGSAILNTLLTIMNEREFYNAGVTYRVPLITMFAASNELPEGEELRALFDRLHFRHLVHEIQETSNFVEMLNTPMVENPEKLISLEDLYAAQQQVAKVKIPMDVIEALKGLRADLLHDDGVMATDRRWKQCLPIIQAEAWLEGEEVADVAHMRPLMHVLWEELSFRRAVTSQVLALANPIDKEATILLDDLAEQSVILTKAIKDHVDNRKARAKVCVEVHTKLKRIKTKMSKLAAEAETVERESEKLEELKARFVQVGQTLMVDGFGLDPDTVPGID